MRQSKPMPLFAALERQAHAGRLAELATAAERAALAVEAAEQALQPFSDAFWAAHGEVARMLAERAGGEPVTKPEIFAAYDTRLLAGHARHPYRRALDEARNWQRAVEMELKLTGKMERGGRQ
jgi:cellobiose-specific phosphotransferase system component IIA